MAAELELQSLTRLQKLSQSQYQSLNPTSSIIPSNFMWNSSAAAGKDDDDSWEVRAFAEDRGNINGTTWPPRSYTCTFCRREFRSAQALGGHMNVHRRDRAKLHHQAPLPSTTNISSSATTAPPGPGPSSTLLIPAAPDFVTNGGLCLLYSLPNPNTSPSSTLFTISPHHISNLDLLMSPSPNSCLNSSFCHSNNTEPSASVISNDCCNIDLDDSRKHSGSININEELDLELRLGCKQ